MASTATHYERLFRRLVREQGPLANETLTSVIGFSAGGPVSMCRVGDGLVTVELSLYEEQLVSAEGIRYELFSRIPIGEDLTREMFTALGNLSMTARLGDGHTVDLTHVLESPDVGQVRLRLHSRAGFLLSRYGLYEVEANGA